MFQFNTTPQDMLRWLGLAEQLSAEEMVRVMGVQVSCEVVGYHQVHVRLDKEIRLRRFQLTKVGGWLRIAD